MFLNLFSHFLRPAQNNVARASHLRTQRQCIYYFHYLLSLVLENSINQCFISRVKLL